MIELQCPWCGAPIAVDESKIGSEARCSSCGRTLIVSSVGGAITFIVPPPVATPPQTQSRQKKLRRSWESTLPVIVPLLALCVVLAAIAIRVVREALPRQEAMSAAPRSATAAVERPIKKPVASEQKPIANSKSVVRAMEPANIELPPRPEPQVPSPAPPKSKDDVAKLAAAPAAPDAAAQKAAREIAISKNLREGKHRFREIVSADLDRVMGECQENLEAQATAPRPDPAVIKILLNELEQLKKEGTLPSAPQYEFQRRSHLEIRRTAAKNLQTTYEETVAELTRALEVERALNLKDEMDEFAKKEGLIESAPAIAAEKATAKPPPPPTVPAFNLADAVAAFSDDVKNVAKLETGALRNEQHQAMMEKVNRRLGAHRATLNFPITEVETSDGRTFFAVLEQPDEIKNIDGLSGDFRRYALSRDEVKQASSIRRGDLVAVSGTPFVAPSSLDTNRFLAGQRVLPLATINFSSSGIPVYRFYLLKYEARVRKKPR